MDVQSSKGRILPPAEKGQHYTTDSGKEERVQEGTIITTDRKSLEDTLERTRKPFHLSKTGDRKM